MILQNTNSNYSDAKVFDLKGEQHMSTIVGMLYAAIKENHQRLQLITNGMTLEELDYKGPTNNYNSTAQLITHLMVVDLHWAYRIKAEQIPSSLHEQYGPMIDAHNKLPMVQGTSLDMLYSNYEAVINMLKDCCAQLTDEDLGNVVTFGHNSEKHATIRWGLWHIADHSRYHQAHINQLRKWYKEANISK